ncbi:hypothetical protein K3495_g3069 [Podosphaera aphanis]|nr:hypothetical protein K3495_g3069 [Podosphaera aphanis]
MDNLMLVFDQFVTGIFSKWDIVSTALFVASITSFVYLIIIARDPDAHPLLLARQSQASQVRQEGESAVFRSHSTPHGVPLNSGLNIKAPGAPKWGNGSDGDLRDIWLKAIAGIEGQQGKTGVTGKLITLLGSEEIVEHDLADITKQINLIGQYLKQNGTNRIAVYLPNSIEFIATLFACAFYGLTTILLPYDQTLDEILNQLEKSKSDTVVAAAGSFPFDAIHKSYPSLKQLIWVVDEGSKHMDWNEVPNGTGGSVNVSTWQEIVQDPDSSAGKELPIKDNSIELGKVIGFVSGQAVEYTHATLVAGVSGQLNSIPNTQRFTPSDLFLSIDCFSSIYPLTLILAALYSNSSVALTSVASHSPSIALATRGISPTIIVASCSTMRKFYNEIKQKISSPLYSLAHWLETRDLVQNGVMPSASYFSSFFDGLRPSIGCTPGELRLIYISTLAGKEKPLSQAILSDLRIYTRARIIYALTAPKVAGAVTQTGIYDYRVSKDDDKAHFGPPVTSLELSFRDKGEYKTTDTISCGEIVVKGPAVVGEKANLGVMGMMNNDFTLSLLN